MKNSMKTTDFNSIKSKYVVSVHILQVDKKGNRKSESMEYAFEDGEILENRRHAILKAQEIMNSFNYSPNQNFSSPSEAKAKGFKNFKAYSIDIILIIEKNGTEYDYTIYGNEELVYDSLEQEAFFFRQMFEITKFVEIENTEEETIKVIEENLYFLLS